MLKNRNCKVLIVCAIILISIITVVTTVMQVVAGSANPDGNSLGDGQPYNTVYDPKDFANKLDPDVWSVLNNIRVQPTYYVSNLNELLSWFTNPDQPLYYYPPDSNVYMMTNEGKTAIQEAIDFLGSQKALPPFKWNNGLYSAAIAHSKDMQAKNYFAHDSIDGTSFSDRVKSYYSGPLPIGENLSLNT